MKTQIGWLLTLLLLATASPADEKILVSNGANVLLVDARTLSTLAKTDVSPAVMPPEISFAFSVGVSFDRRYAIVTDLACNGLVILDLTRPNLPVITRIGGSISTGTSFRFAVTVRDGLAAVTTGIVPQKGFLRYFDTVDLTTTPPSVTSSNAFWWLKARGVSRPYAATPDGKTVYIADGMNSGDIIVFDMTQTPPRSMNVIKVGPSLLTAIQISNDGTRLVVTRGYPLSPSVPLTARIWDIRAPHSPQFISDVTMPWTFPAACTGAFDPADRFLVQSSYTVWPSGQSSNSSTHPGNSVNIIDTHANPPQVLGGTTFGPDFVSSCMVSRDGQRAWVVSQADLGPWELREVDLSNPAQPVPTGRSIAAPTGGRGFHQFREGVMFGELHASGAALVGAPHPIFLSSPNDAGKAYALAASFATRPGTAIGKRILPLQIDALFTSSRANPAVFHGFTGVLDANGQAAAFLIPPPLPALRGLVIYVAGVVMDTTQPFGIGTVTNAEAIAIR